MSLSRPLATPIRPDIKIDDVEEPVRDKQTDITTMVMENHDGTLNVLRGGGNKISNTLKAGIYTIEHDKVKDEYPLKFFTSKFAAKESEYTYGKTLDNLGLSYKRVLIQKKNELPTGLLYYGDKGTGKSAGAELLSNRLIKLGCAVIYITAPVAIAALKKLAFSGLKNLVLYFDEVDKNYRDRGENNIYDMNQFLSVLGNIQTNTLVTIFTANKINALPQEFFDRPARIQGLFSHTRLGTMEIIDIANAEGLSKVQVDSIIGNVGSLNYNALKFIIETIKDDDLTNGVTEDMLSTMNIDVGEGIKIKVTNIVTGGVPVANDTCWLMGRDRILNYTHNSKRKMLSIPKEKISNLNVTGPQTFKEDDVEITYEVERDTQDQNLRDKYRLQVDIPDAPAPVKPNNQDGNVTTTTFK